jgi:hypothetical protein
LTLGRAHRGVKPCHGMESKNLALILAKSENHAIKWRAPDKSVQRETRDQLPARRWDIGGDGRDFLI